MKTIIIIVILILYILYQYLNYKERKNNFNEIAYLNSLLSGTSFFQGLEFGKNNPNEKNIIEYYKKYYNSNKGYATALNNYLILESARK